MISAYFVTAALTAAVHVLLVLQSKKTYGLSVWAFIKQVITRVTAVTVPAGLLVYFVSIPVVNRFVQLVLETAFSVAVTGVCVLILGLNTAERNALFSFVQNKLRRKKEN